MTRRCARPGQYACWKPVVWALTTVLRDGWEFACAAHLNQVAARMEHQAKVELVRADRVKDDGDIRISETELAREAILTAGRDTWHYGYLKSDMEDVGLDISGDRCRELLEGLADEGFITRTGGADWAKTYALTSNDADPEAASERPIGYRADG